MAGKDGKVNKEKGYDIFSHIVAYKHRLLPNRIWLRYYSRQPGLPLSRRTLYVLKHATTG